MNSEPDSLRTRLGEVTILRQNAKTADDMRRYTSELLKLMNEINRLKADRTNAALDKLLTKKKPSKSDIARGQLVSLRRVLAEAFETQQRNDAKIRRLLASVADKRSIDDSNVHIYRQVARLLREANLIRRLVARRGVTRKATAARRQIGERSRRKVDEALANATATGASGRKAREDVASQVSLSPERVRKIIARTPRGKTR